MKLKHWLRYFLWSDTTWHGEFSALRPLLQGLPEEQRVVVDVGANDGFYSSNSYPFVKRGWRAILVEPHPGAFAQADEAKFEHLRKHGYRLAKELWADTVWAS